MANAKIQTVETAASVSTFLKKVNNEQKQKDCFTIVEIMKEKSGFEPRMWGPAIVGFGKYHYKYESGREGDMPLIAFSPRKTEIVLYLSPDFDDKEELLKKFGKHKTTKACIYVKKLADVDINVLKKMIANSLKETKKKYN